MKRGSGVGRAAAFVAAAALLSAFSGAVATSASPSAGKRGSVVYRLALTGALHIHAEEVGKCSGGGTISSVEDSVLQVSTPRSQKAWVVADNHTAPPPGFLPASPGIYGFGHNGWLRFGVVTQMQGHYEDCEKAPTSTHCSRAGTVDGRFESSRHPRTMYFSLLHLQPRGCYSQFQDDFVADLHGRAALARVPLGAIVHRVPSTFGLHQRQRGRFDTWTVTSDLDWDAHIAPADELVAVA